MSIFLGYEIKQVSTEEWFATEYVVRNGGSVLHSASSPFPRLKCRIWVLLHVARIV